jgi:hypothetical protein
MGVFSDLEEISLDFRELHNGEREAQLQPSQGLLADVMMDVSWEKEPMLDAPQVHGGQLHALLQHHPNPP